MGKDDQLTNPQEFMSGKPRLTNPDPIGIYSGMTLRNAIQGDGFVPGDPDAPPKPKKQK